MAGHGDHSDLWDYIESLRDEIRALENRVRALEGQTPQARQLQHEADVAAADLAESGYDRHGPGCGCPYCPDEDDLAGLSTEAGR